MKSIETAGDDEDIDVTIEWEWVIIFFFFDFSSCLDFVHSRKFFSQQFQSSLKGQKTCGERLKVSCGEHQSVILWFLRNDIIKHVLEPSDVLEFDVSWLRSGWRLKLQFLGSEKYTEQNVTNISWVSPHQIIYGYYKVNVKIQKKSWNVTFVTSNFDNRSFSFFNLHQHIFDWNIFDEISISLQCASFSWLT